MCTVSSSCPVFYLCLLVSVFDNYCVELPIILSNTSFDFLNMFQDARQRPDAKTLLSHTWIQNSRRVLQSSLRHSGTVR